MFPPFFELFHHSQWQRQATVAGAHFRPYGRLASWSSMRVAAAFKYE